MSRALTSVSPVFGQRLGVLDVAADNGPNEFGSFISVGDGQANSHPNHSKPRLLGKAARVLIKVFEPLRGILKLEGRQVKIIVKFGRQKIGFVFENDRSCAEELCRQGAQCSG